MVITNLAIALIITEVSSYYLVFCHFFDHIEIDDPATATKFFLKFITIQVVQKFYF